jgi:hypothetical protein
LPKKSSAKLLDTGSYLDVDRWNISNPKTMILSPSWTEEEPSSPSCNVGTNVKPMALSPTEFVRFQTEGNVLGFGESIETTPLPIHMPVFTEGKGLEGQRDLE